MIVLHQDSADLQAHANVIVFVVVVFVCFGLFVCSFNLFFNYYYYTIFSYWGPVHESLTDNVFRKVSSVIYLIHHRHLDGLGECGSEENIKLFVVSVETNKADKPMAD